MKNKLLWMFIGLVVVFVGGLCLRYYFPDLRGPHVPVDKMALQAVSGMGTEALLLAGDAVLNVLAEGSVFALQDSIASDGLTFLPYPNYGLLEDY